MTLIEQFRVARAVATPLIAISTPDQGAVITMLAETLNGTVPLLQWDIVRGLQAVNPAGGAALSTALDSKDPRTVTNPVDAVVVANKLPNFSVLFLHNAHRFFAGDRSVAFVQGLWNLRDANKSQGRTTGLLGPSFTFPPELQQDVLTLDDPMPTRDQLRAIVQQCLGDINDGRKDAKVSPLELQDAELERALDALRGLAPFPAEQTVHMNVAGDRLDFSGLWARKRQMIEQTPGASVRLVKERFNDIGGCGNVKQYIGRLLSGRDRPNAVVFIDEVDKAMAGAEGGDLSGVSQEIHGEILKYMQDLEVEGALFLGPPGSGKSAVAKAAAAEAPGGGIECIEANLPAMKASLVGQSIANVRQFLKVVTAVSDGRPLFLATCNRISGLSPELRRRFTMTFFFDLPNEEERGAIWSIYLKKYNVSPTNIRPDDAGWTGAEIHKCCRTAYKLGCTLVEASAFIVPVSVAAADTINVLRTEAAGKYTSASYPGPFQLNVATAVHRRRIASRG